MEDLQTEAEVDATVAPARPHWRDVPVTTWYQRRGKRLLDVVLGAVLLVLLLPVLAVAVLLVLVAHGRPVLYRQDRPGRHGRTFRILKLRTMHPDRRGRANGRFPGADRRREAKTTTDPRHTRLGRFLRETSLDELPQLLNVLRGDMGLVGPRPEILSVAVRKDIVHHARHAYRPGLTCIWQVEDRSQGDLAGKLRQDERYVARVTLLGDLRLLARTPVALVRRRGQ
jgi:lipopolysaccharide/colanic/teichoic acid biosynthesis glycosyltransferase